MKPRDKARLQRLADHLLNRPALCTFTDTTAEACHRQKDEEGWSEIGFILQLLPSGEILMAGTEHGRDCDGYMSRDTSLVYRERRKARRFYMSTPPRWCHRERGERPGRFEVKRYNVRQLTESERGDY